MVMANGSSVTNSSGIQLAIADDVGEFDQFVSVPGLGSNDSSAVQVVQTGIANVTGPGNGTVILVPTQGISVISDIDDVLRITKVYVPNQGLYNSFVQPYVNVPGIPELFENWSKSLQGAAFHYDTTTPLQLTRTYVDYLFSNFPLGSLEMRPINLTDPSQILEARQNSLLKLFQTFPQRKFGASSMRSWLNRYNFDRHMLPSSQCLSAIRPPRRCSRRTHRSPSSSPTTSRASSSAIRLRPTRMTRFHTTPARSRTSRTAHTSSTALLRVCIVLFVLLRVTLTD